MGLFKDVYCKKCGNKVGLLARKWLADGNCVCSKCASVIPSFVRSGIGKWDYPTFTEVLRYLDYSKKVIAPQFKCTHEFWGLELDARNGWFCIEKKLFGDTLFFQVEDVESINLTYDPEKFKEGFLADKVTGNVGLNMEMNFPAFRLDKLVAVGVKADATLKSGVFSDKVKYDNPKGMDEFMAAFGLAHETYVENYVEGRFVAGLE